MENAKYEGGREKERVWGVFLLVIFLFVSCAVFWGLFWVLIFVVVVFSF